MRILGALAAATLAATLLAGCGTPAPPVQTTPPPVSEQPPATSPTPVTEAPPAGAGVEEFLQRVTGVTMTTYTMKMEMVTEIEGNEMPISSTGSFDNTDPDAPRSHLTMQVMGTEMELIQVGDDAYLKMAAMGDQWMKMDAESAAELSSGGSPDLGQWTQEYAKNLESVEFVGDEQVSGVTASHYRLTMKPEALRELGVSDGTDATQVLFEVWVDGDGFTRQFAVEVDSSVKAKISATMDNFNQPVTIEAPKDWVEMPK
ncbi:MAG: LppX_LprAFG lipoprotein [Propionicimonas sp.]